jgi:hypothetical protein
MSDNKTIELLNGIFTFVKVDTEFKLSLFTRLTPEKTVLLW